MCGCADGGITTLFVLPSGEALCVAWQGDNTGPAPLEAVQGSWTRTIFWVVVPLCLSAKAVPVRMLDRAGFYDHLTAQYEGAEVLASSFDAFFAAANTPALKKLLPVVTGEIEDGRFTSAARLASRLPWALFAWF